MVGTQIPGLNVQCPRGIAQGWIADPGAGPVEDDDILQAGLFPCPPVELEKAIRHFMPGELQSRLGSSACLSSLGCGEITDI